MLGRLRVCQLSVLLLAMGCGGGRPAGPRVTGDVARAEPLPIEHVVVDDRPPLTLVTRGGDPEPAVAFVARHGRGGAASAALLGLVQARLEAAGLTGSEARAHGLGIELSRLIASEEDLERFFAAVHGALAQPVRGDEPAIGRARSELLALAPLRFAGPADAAAAACSGELGLPEAGAALDLTKPEGLRELENARSASFRVDAAAFAVLGTEPLLSDAPDALGDSRAWPTDSADDDAWPGADFAGVDRAASSRSLSVALWVADADRAAGAGAALAAADSPLLARLENLSPPWQLTRASAIARRRGACLRLDVNPPKGDPGPDGGEVGRVAAVVEQSALAALADAGPGALDDSVLRPTDPRRAAALAAWRGLPSTADPAETRRTIAYVAAASDPVTSADLVKGLADARSRLTRPSVEVTERLEPGQGEIWMLLASPCGTAVESVADAGAFSLVLRALARENDSGGVRFEPWVTPDGVGLLAHGARGSPAEPGLDQAARVAAALGRALTSRFDGSDLAAARSELLRELGGRAFPGFSLALDGLSPEHPSWLEPRGLWQSVSELPTEALERARRQLLASPLRLSVLSNSPNQARAAAGELESWLLTHRAEPRACPSFRAVAPRRGQTRVEAKNEPGLEGGYVAVALGTTGAQAARIAELSAMLLNRPGGPLERALAASGPGAAARAHALGGTRRPALLIDVRALPERLADAVGRVRAALDQQARGTLTSDEYALAARELGRREAQARFDPRRRIVDLFRGDPAHEPDFATVRSAQAAFGSGAHWVVSVVPAP